jgi:hypothetical protein
MRRAANVSELRRIAVALLLMWSAMLVALSAQHTTASRDFFFVGGTYASQTNNELMTGQMYVEVLHPARVTQRYPLVFFHGGGQTATNWIGTPDGRSGWADYFLSQGYVVYLIDQPARGRSAWHASANGPLQSVSASTIEQRFTAPERAGTWPQAKKHTQWPGTGEKKGLRGDPIFDAFYANRQLTTTRRDRTAASGLVFPTYRSTDWRNRAGISSPMGSESLPRRSSEGCIMNITCSKRPREPCYVCAIMIIAEYSCRRMGCSRQGAVRAMGHHSANVRHQALARNRATAGYLPRPQLLGRGSGMVRRLTIRGESRSQNATRRDDIDHYLASFTQA